MFYCHRNVLCYLFHAPFPLICSALFSKPRFCPFPFSVTDPLTIEADIHKEYGCSDHYFVISSSSSYRPWIWGSETDVVKVVWNCNDLYIYGPSGNVSALSFSVTIHHLKNVLMTKAVNLKQLLLQKLKTEHLLLLD